MSDFMIELLIEDKRGNIITHQLGEGRHTLGQSTDADIVVMDEYTSRYHADIFVNKTGVFFIDMNSTNGIWHEGERISTILKVDPGMSVTVGRMKLTVRAPKHALFVKEGRKPDLGDVETPPSEAGSPDAVDNKIKRILMS